MAQTRRKAGPAESGPRVFRQAEQMQACAFLFVPFGAGAHTALPRELHFSIFILQLRAAFEASFLFLASQNRETKQREKAAANVRALKNRTGHYPPRNSRAENFQHIQNDF